MKRRIITIDEEKCNGCGACANACHEGAIGMVNGKAKLMRDDYCDGLGDCLPACPTGAITFVEREAAAYDEQAVLENKRKKMQAQGQSGTQMPLHAGCPGTQMRRMHHAENNSAAGQGSIAGLNNNAGQNGVAGMNNIAGQSSGTEPANAASFSPVSQLSQWPVQIKLVPVNAPYFDGAKLLIAADCTAYAYAGFHEKFIKNHITLIGCPKLDDVDYSEKLTQIIANNNIKSITIVRMEVPCCGGIEYAVKKAIQDSGKFLPWQCYTISIDGNIIDK
jgi:Fe-S-cluster-containing hydrogenase component 2